MKMLALILTPLFALFLSGCELPDIEGLNSMPKTTRDMGANTKSALHKQTLLLALTEMNKPENQENIFPIPTGLMPAGKVFAEEATPEELIELTYNELKKLDENTIMKGFDENGDPIALTDEEMAKGRLRKRATLASLQIIAGFAQDEKIDAIISHDIEGNGRFAETGLQFLALRSYFIREVLLKLSLNIATDKPQTLNNSGKMNEALKYLLKLDRISKLSFDNYPTIQLKFIGEAAFTGFDENVNVTRAETPKIWQLAVDKAIAGSQVFERGTKPGTNQAAEQAAQRAIIEAMQGYANSWKP